LQGGLCNQEAFACNLPPGYSRHPFSFAPFEPFRPAPDQNNGAMRTPDDIFDELLVLRCQDGDAEALVELVHRWRPRLLRHAQRLTSIPDAADDVVQAAWVAILRGLSRLEDPACFRRWAYRITTHKCADWVRSRQRDRAHAIPLTQEPVDEKLEAESAQDDVAALVAALKELPPDQKMVLSMCYLDDMPLAEIADALGLPLGTVKSRLHYARLKLKQHLEKEKS
jgi:RNA polymerase sigma factor (sigma-70 family)